MVYYYIHERMTLEAAKAYQTIYDTLHANPDLLDPSGDDRVIAFQNFIIYLMLSPHTNEKVDLMNIVNSMYTRQLDNPAHDLLAKFLRRFLSTELLPFEAREVEEGVKVLEPFREDTTEHAATHMQEFLR